MWYCSNYTFIFVLFFLLSVFHQILYQLQKLFKARLEPVPQANGVVHFYCDPTFWAKNVSNLGERLHPQRCGLAFLHVSYTYVKTTIGTHNYFRGDRFYLMVQKPCFSDKNYYRIK